MEAAVRLFRRNAFSCLLGAMLAMSWNIAQAKQHFSDVVKQSADEPQLLYNRDRLVAAVINAEQFSSFQTWRQRQNMKTLGEAFAELRQLIREENHELEIPPRTTRLNAFVAMLEEEEHDHGRD